MLREVIGTESPAAIGTLDLGRPMWRPKPHLYLTVIAIWAFAVCWFHPYLAALIDLGTGPFSTAALWFFVLFIDVAWAYAAYNIAVILFGILYRRQSLQRGAVAESPERPPVALLYTTCNDFVPESVISCVQQEYASYRVYILDDSSDAGIRARIDAFAVEYADRVTVVRRGDRRAYKAGNLNHALSSVAREPLFALVDADEILPRDFLARLVPRILAIPDCGFIQANHRSNPNAISPLARDLGPGVDSHWRWYHPLRNDYGFVMLLGHGALIRRQAWLDAGGFPELVSEDLAFALRAREAGWRGRFAEDVLCIEEFPEDVRAFRVRHMKWTRGTCEFLSREALRLLLTHRLTWVEKIDILLPTLNLPLSFLFFLFVIDANVILTTLYGDFQIMTWLVGGHEWRIPTLQLDSAFAVLNRHDLFVATILAMISPVLCFLIDMWRRPGRLWSFLARSTALYGALGPLSSIGVLLFAVTRRAVFHVTADKTREPVSTVRRSGLQKWRAGIHEFALRSHPDHKLVQGLEIVCALVLVALACATFQVPFLGLALGYLMFPVMHHLRWDAFATRALVHIPFALIVSGFGIGSLSLMGVQTVFFGYGFHF